MLCLKRVAKLTCYRADKKTALRQKILYRCACCERIHSLLAWHYTEKPRICLLMWYVLGNCIVWSVITIYQVVSKPFKRMDPNKKKHKDPT